MYKEAPSIPISSNRDGVCDYASAAQANGPHCHSTSGRVLPRGVIDRSDRVTYMLAKMHKPCSCVPCLQKDCSQIFPFMCVEICAAFDVLAVNIRVMHLHIRGLVCSIVCCVLHSDGRGWTSALECGVDRRVVDELRTPSSEGFAWPAEMPVRQRA